MRALGRTIEAELPVRNDPEAWGEGGATDKQRNCPELRLPWSAPV
jgi:hypothetical protein